VVESEKMNLLLRYLKQRPQQPAQHELATKPQTSNKAFSHLNAANQNPKKRDPDGGAPSSSYVLPIGQGYIFSDIIKVPRRN